MLIKVNTKDTIELEIMKDETRIYILFRERG